MPSSWVEGILRHRPGLSWRSLCGWSGVKNDPVVGVGAGMLARESWNRTSLQNDRRVRFFVSRVTSGALAEAETFSLAALQHRRLAFPVPVKMQLVACLSSASTFWGPTNLKPKAASSRKSWRCGIGAAIFGADACVLCMCKTPN